MPPPSQWQEGPQRATLRPLRVTQLYELWETHPDQKDGNATGTLKRYRAVFKALAKDLGDPLAATVTTQQVGEFFDKLRAKGVSARTVQDVHRAAISSVFNWAKRRGRVTLNPATENRVKVSRKSHASRGFTDRHATAILSAARSIEPSNKQPLLAASKRWVPLLLAYSGSRVQEITQLRKIDVQQHAEGFWFLHLTPDAGIIKTGEERKVPLHPRLIETGFLAFVRAANDGPLFFDPAARRNPNAECSQAESRAGDLSQWVRKVLDIKPGVRGPAPNHGWRHRFKSACRFAGIEKQYSDAIMGHGKQDVADSYGGFALPVLYREICKLTSEAIEGA